MSLLGNIVWFLFGGVWAAIGWVIAGIICSITIEVRDSGTGAMGLSYPKLEN